MQLITPYSDNTMTYDAEKHQYILTLAYVKDKLGVDLPERINTAPSDDPQRVAQAELERISDEIYSYIYAHNSNNEVQEYFVAKLESTRVIIRDAMKEQLAYNLTSGALSRFSGVNVKTGQVIDQKALRKAVIGFDAEKILDKVVPEIGVALTYQGYLMMPIGANIRGDY